MPFSKTIDVKGITCQYWRITEVLVDVFSNTTRVVMSGYQTAEAAEADLHNDIGREVIFLPQIYLSLQEIETALMQPIIIKGRDAEGNLVDISTPSLFGDAQQVE